MTFSTYHHGVLPSLPRKDGGKTYKALGFRDLKPQQTERFRKLGVLRELESVFFKVFFSSYSRLLNHMKRPYRGMRMEILFIFDAGSSTGLSLTTETEGVQCKFARQLRGLFSAPM